MSPELSQKIYNACPKLYRKKDDPTANSCMCYGLACGDGWFNLLNILSLSLEALINSGEAPELAAEQVKEKFGTLRFYLTYCKDTEISEKTREKIDKLVKDAEMLSSITCEQCGLENAKCQRRSGWVSTLCEKCAKEKEEE